MALKLTAAQFAQICRHGESTYPHECCGVFTGDLLPDGSKKVVTVAPCGNAHNDKSRSWYQIDPRELVRIQRDAIERGEDVIGFYHSHPDDAAQWSASDLDEAHWTGCSYLITSVIEGRAAQSNSFELTGDEASKRFEEEESWWKNRERWSNEGFHNQGHSRSAREERRPWHAAHAGV